MQAQDPAYSEPEPPPDRARPRPPHIHRMPAPQGGSMMAQHEVTVWRAAERSVVPLSCVSFGRDGRTQCSCLPAAQPQAQDLGAIIIT